MKSVAWKPTRRNVLLWIAGAVTSTRWHSAFAGDSIDVPIQPYFASVNRALEALEKLGAPVSPVDAQKLATLAHQNDASAVIAADEILGRYTLVTLSVGTDGSAHVTPGGAPRQLVEQGWRSFLVRIDNRSRKTDSVLLSSGAWTLADMERLGGGMAQRAYLLDRLNKGPLIEKMWLTSEVYEATPIVRWGSELQSIPLSGIPLEYRIVQMFSRDRGLRTADLTLYILPRSDGAGVKSGHRQLDFECLPSRNVALAVIDADGRGCVASLIIKDTLNRIYPPQAMRIAPDMFFQEQIYRADGETVRLPDGEYTIESKRGPEYLRGTQRLTVDGDGSRIDVKLKRWIDPANRGWYSGDTHIHAAGCAHYQIPTEGVSPETMIRHMRGEALSIGDALNWGPSWYYQKQFFSGRADSPLAGLEHAELQRANSVTLEPKATAEDAESILRYDVEVSGFPSSHAGHLVLMRLSDQDYPGTKLIEDWPSWNLPILQWAKAQGALAGYAHCGNGMVVDSNNLPNYEVPPMDDNGTQEAIIDVTHGFVDFLSGCDTIPIAELNAWYHMLNCGFRMAMIGETDFPCYSGERVGMGRSYVQLDTRPVGNVGYEAWVRGLLGHRQYCSDGRSHILESKINGQALHDADLVFKAGHTVTFEALVAARLEPEVTPEIEARRANDRGYDIEKARIAGTREVPLELVMNGSPVAAAKIVADGVPRWITLKAKVDRSSWLALRILPSVHGHPVFANVGGKPIRASRRSAQWCRACVDKVWDVKSPFIRETERADAEKAFDHARRVYETITTECEVE